MVKVEFSLKDKINLLAPYVSKKITDQVRAVALIILYLTVFQTVVLGIPISQASVLAGGIAVIIVGLAFFMEGLFLGLMPLGEVIGIRLPQKSKLPVILLFSFLLGIGVTLAEPAISVLQVAGSFIKPWDAPLLFLLLNRYADILKFTVGLGVGLAVIFGMLRFMYNWSLKPYIFVLVPIVTVASLIAFFEPNLKHLLSLAWDTGAVTTGPVTVPLVLALGVGITRVMSKGDAETGGFGVVTLASLFPIVAVIILGLVLLPTVPKPMDQQAFFSASNQAKAERLFNDRTELISYALQNAEVSAQKQLFDGSRTELLNYVEQLKHDSKLRRQIFGSQQMEAMERWAVSNGSPEQRRVVFATSEAERAAVVKYRAELSKPLDLTEVSVRHGMSALQAVLPLSLFLLAVLVIFLREKLPHADEVFLGIFFALAGMFLFNIGIELGLAKLGNQVGSMLPSSFKQVELTEQTRIIHNFDEDVVITSLRPDGTQERFFYTNMNNAYVQVPFHEARFDEASGQYIHVPARGPLFGGEDSLTGFLVVLIFAFIMGYGATLAEPALNALGVTVETLTAGAFRKTLLIQAVGVGVGMGITMGMVKIIWSVPLIFLITPPYVLLLFLTFFSTEEYVNIGWDSAGVTTGPITVPLVLAIGLGVGGQVGAVEGFGILACASVFPILTVLTVGMTVNIKKRALYKGTEDK